MTDIQQRVNPSGERLNTGSGESNLMPMDKLTFEELMERHPILKDKGWGADELTVFLKTGFIRGEIREEDDVLLYDEESIFKLIDIHDQILSDQMIELNEQHPCSK